MEEELVSFETAKLAHQKGFNIPTPQYYDLIRNKQVTYLNLEENEYYKNDNPNMYSKPTQSLLQKWLREVHNIDILIEFVDDVNKIIYGYYLAKNKEYKNVNNKGFKIYEEALEKGLQEALKLIKDNGTRN